MMLKKMAFELERTLWKQIFVNLSAIKLGVASLGCQPLFVAQQVGITIGGPEHPSGCQPAVNSSSAYHAF
jgi:hypothetical protein